MRFTTLFTSILGLTVTINLSGASPAPATPSPSCSYSCSLHDSNNFAIGDSSSDNGVLFCSYPAFANENPMDFYCTYSSSTGAIISDKDAGFCPRSAVTSCNGRRRR